MNRNRRDRDHQVRSGTERDRRDDDDKLSAVKNIETSVLCACGWPLPSLGRVCLGRVLECFIKSTVHDEVSFLSMMNDTPKGGE